MTERRVERIAVRLGVSLSVLVLLVLFVGPFVFPWADLNSHVVEIDLSSGRERETHWLLGIPFSSERETAGSRLYRELVGKPREPLWRAVTYTTPALRAHPSHHCSAHALASLVEATGMPGMTTDARKKALVTFFELLREFDYYHPASEYSSSVYEVISRWKPGDPPIGPDELPEPPRKP